jgi:hypothetical protein
MATSAKSLRERALNVLSSRDREWFSADFIEIAIDDAAGEPIDCTEIDAALDALVAEGKAEHATIDGVSLYRASRRRPRAETNRWHEALAQYAANLDKTPFDSAPKTARSIRTALAIGVRSEHDARLVLAALGFKTEEGISAVLGKDAA